MNRQQIGDLWSKASSLTYYSDLLLATFDDISIPADFGSMEDYREHLANMIGAYFQDVTIMYAAVDGWQTPKVTWEH